MIVKEKGTQMRSFFFYYHVRIYYPKATRLNSVTFTSPAAFK